MEQNKFALCLLVCSLVVSDVYSATMKLPTKKANVAVTFATASDNVIHLEMDEYYPGSVIYTDDHSVMTSDGVMSTTVAGNATEEGYLEGHGSEARFRNVFGFTQLTLEKEVIVADTWNHCLRKVNRDSTATSVWTGQCEKAGYKFGKAGQFRYPYAVMRDQNDKDQLLVTDSGNKAVRTVNIATGAIGTFVQSNALNVLRYLTQDKSGDMFVTAANSIQRISYADKKVTLIAGSPTKRGYEDLDLLSSLFNYPYDIALVGPQEFLVADPGNQKIRLLDLAANKVTTLNVCKGCALMRTPNSVLINNGSLYAGERKRIQKYTYSDLTFLAKVYKTKTTQKPKRPSTTPKSIFQNCKDKNLTVYVKAGEKKIQVEIVDGFTSDLSVGNHVIRMAGCTVRVDVRYDASGTTTCSPKILRFYVGSDEERAQVEITTGVVMSLPVGSYNYVLYGGCNVAVNVINRDTLLMRRLGFTSTYSVSCSLLEDKIVKATLSSIVNSKFNQLKFICDKDCAPSSPAVFGCENGLLAVTWPTDVVYDISTKRIPADLEQRLSERLLSASRHPILDLVIVSNSPPVVYPIKKKTGAYAALKLTSTCLHSSTTYDKVTDSCI